LPAVAPCTVAAWTWEVRLKVDGSPSAVKAAWQLARRCVGLGPELMLRESQGSVAVKKLVDAGSAQGQVDQRERRLIHRVFEFGDKTVGQIMTPRDKVFALSYDLPMQRLVKEIAARGFSRVPIYQKSLDNVRGILNAKDLVNAAAAQAPTRPLNELLHEPLFVPRTTPVKRLFLTFKQKKVHMAIVVSEYGKVLGLVTMDDLLAQIFGVIRDERAELQASNPNIKLPRPRTPPGSPDTGPIPRQPEPVRPIHPVDEVTPPAVDIEELVHTQGNGKGQN
jgi:CBS domain containing-hemolysin-like protein